MVGAFFENVICYGERARALVLVWGGAQAKYGEAGLKGVKARGEPVVSDAEESRTVRRVHCDELMKQITTVADVVIAICYTELYCALSLGRVSEPGDSETRFKYGRTRCTDDCIVAEGSWFFVRTWGLAHRCHWTSSRFSKTRALIGSSAVCQRSCGHGNECRDIWVS